QLDDPHWQPNNGQGSLLRSTPAIVAKPRWDGRVTAVWTALHRLVVRQQPRQGANGRRLCGAAVAANQGATDPGIDGIEQQGALHLLLTDERGERQRQFKWHSVSLASHGSAKRPWDRGFESATGYDPSQS